MQEDERTIRDLIATWNRLTKEGNTERVLELMTDDVVFTVVGRPPFGKREFAAGMQQLRQVKVDAHLDILEIVVRGDTAWARVQLRVDVTKPDGATVRREGHVMSIYTRQSDGRWLLARDANLLGSADP